MKILSQDPFSQNGLFILHGNEWLEKQREAGKIAAKVLSHLEFLVYEKESFSLIDLDAIAEDIILNAGAKPTFKGYKGFPASICTSVNEQLVHGIPTNYKLNEGDLVTFDVGVTVDGAIADTAITCIYGEPKKPWHAKIVKAAEEALYKGIESIAVGKKLGVIGNAINKSIKGNGFNVITKYGGHGLSWDELHVAPFVDNKSDSNKGFRITSGLVLAIEPMVVVGSTDTEIKDNGWTVTSLSRSAHAEHSVFIHENYVEIITKRDSE